MNYATLCSGIEACSVAWHPLGFEPVFFSEIEPFPKAVLKHHYPNVPDLGDMTLYQDWKDYGTIDLICAGTPCQAFSVAGLREGLADPRGNLTLVFLGVLAKYRPRWVVWENVPGVLSDRSNAFGQFVAGLSELGYGVSWRVLDAQYFGVAQRRRRVFVVGCLGDWRAAAAVLLDPHSLSGNPAPSRKTGKGSAGSAAFSTGNSGIREVSDTVTSKWATGSGGPSGNETGNMVLQPIPINTMVAQGRPSDNGRMGSGIGKPGGPANTITKTHAHAVDAPVMAYKVLSPGPRYYESHPNDSRVTGPHDVGNSVTSRWGTGGGNTPTVLNDQGRSVMNVESNGLTQPIPIDLRNAGRDAEKHDAMNRQGLGVGDDGDPAHTLSSAFCHGVATHMAIRRITPTEAERLQGFPDGHTNIPWRGKPESPDGPRYKAIGNSMAVPVMRWLGGRIKDVDDYMKASGA